MAESKTAKASKVVEKFEKKVIPDAELIRLLRIDRAAHLYPTTQGADALLRTYDAEHERLAETEAEVITLKAQVENLELHTAGDETIMEELRTRVAELENELEETKSALHVAERELENIKTGE